MLIGQNTIYRSEYIPIWYLRLLKQSRLWFEWFYVHNEPLGVQQTDSWPVASSDAGQYNDLMTCVQIFHQTEAVIIVAPKMGEQADDVNISDNG